MDRRLSLRVRLIHLPPQLVVVVVVVSILIRPASPADVVVVAAGQVVPVGRQRRVKDTLVATVRHPAVVRWLARREAAVV